MRRITFKTTNEEEPIIVLGDTHIDHPNTDLRKIKRHIKYINDNDLPWVHLGDWADAINSKDKRYDVNENRESVIDAYLQVEELFNPIAPKCIAALRGNHGSKWSKTEGDYIRVMCKRWDIPYLGYCGLLKVRLPKKSYKIWLHHGAGGGRKRGAKAIRLQDWAQFVDADIYLQGHTHTYQNFVDTQITFTGNKTRYFGNVPGYIRSYTGHDGYVEELGLPPQPTGGLVLTLSDIAEVVLLK